jgi:glycosyltransferase involved in cell wall biosynthesis
MKVFMLGWEFPPFISGGLGTACYGLTKAMDELGVEVTFVLPKASTSHHTGHVKMLSAQHFEEGGVSSTFKNVRFLTIASTLRPYAHATAHERQLGSLAAQQTKTPANIGLGQINDLNDYSGDIYSEVCRYADKAVRIAETEKFDVIHAHDWMTYPAGEAVSQQSHKPLIVHVHSTEFDRSGEHVNQNVYDIERAGMHAAAKVITVSNFTKNTILKHYGVSSEKVDVVHNAVEHNGDGLPHISFDQKDKIVLFLGRITMQKGPEYFLAAAKKVLQVVDNVKFIMAGNGDMMHRTIELAARMGIGHKVLFTGFLRGEDVDRAYQMADLYVMPSVSEPFGIASLEAMNRNVPILISKQSGIAEVVTHALKVDFWDIDEMANKMTAVLKRPPLKATLGTNGFHESHKFNWEDSAMKVKKIYEEVIAQAQSKEE